MNIILAENAGFCFGVKRALDIVTKESSNSNDKVYTYGPIIHNEQVIEELEAQGVFPIQENEVIDKDITGSIVIRAHGVGKGTMDGLESKGLNIIDATCPFVKKIHNAVMEQSQKGYKIVIIGDPKHPEVRGIVGWIKGNDYEIIENESEANNVVAKKGQKIFVVAQTTFSFNKFKELVEILEKKEYYVLALNTICSATEIRQKEAVEIAGKVDAMFVIGGKNSSNSRKLFEVCKEVCDDTYFIQSAADIDPSVLQSVYNVGITAGASTPEKIIKEVIVECQK